MKKVLLALSISTLFVMGGAQAKDQSITINIDGVVNNSPEGSCIVTPSVTSIMLTGEVEKLPEQDVAVSNPTMFSLKVSGDEDCDAKVSTGQIGVQLKGTADDANGTALANTNNLDTAAKGVGVGIYNANGDMLKINNNHDTITEEGISYGLNLVKLAGQTPSAGPVHSALTVEIERL